MYNIGCGIYIDKDKEQCIQTLLNVLDNANQSPTVLAMCRVAKQPRMHHVTSCGGRKNVLFIVVLLFIYGYFLS